MSSNRAKAAAKIFLLFAYSATFGIAFWRAFRRRSNGVEGSEEGRSPESLALLAESLPALPSPGNPSPAIKGDHLEDLSPDTPGNSPLDRLARRAAREEENKVLFRPAGGIADPKSPLPEGPSHPWTYTSEEVSDLLEQQSLESKQLTGWSIPMPERLPVPTYAPAVMAFGIVMFAMGLATTWYVCLIGSAVFAVAAWRWTGELQGK